MNNVSTHAERELDILKTVTPDAVILEFEAEIVNLCKAFGNSGQSGGSAPFVSGAIASAVKELMMFKTLTPLTGENSEWNDVSDWNDGKTMFQNKRDSRVFKDGIDGKAYFIEAIVFDGNIGGRFTSHGSVECNGKIINSSQYIKSFPFKPKTFYVDVIDHRFKDKEEKVPDINGHWWKHSILNANQLTEVFEYYDKN